MKLYIMLIKLLRTDGAEMYLYIKLKADYMAELDFLFTKTKMMLFVNIH